MAQPGQMQTGDLLEAGGLSVGPWQALAVLAGTAVALVMLNLVAPRLGLLDSPDGGRKRHARPVPLTGGLAIIIGVGLSALFGMRLGSAPVDVLALLGIVAVIHAVDDQSGEGRHGLSAGQRLMLDGMVALAFVMITGGVIDTFGVMGDTTLWLGPLAVPFTILIYLSVTNAYNMVDGLDGLALSQFLIPFVAFAVWQAGGVPGFAAAPPALAVILACLVVLGANLGVFGGFLRCFLGDSGARLLGFLLVYVLIEEGGQVFPPPTALFFVAVPLVDLCAVVGERVRARQTAMHADRRHLHHLLTDTGLGPARVVLVMALMSLGCIALAVLLRAADVGPIGLIVAFLAVCGLYWQTRRALVRRIGRLLGSAPVLGPAE